VGVKPPICEHCDERFGPADGGLVTFAPTPESEAWHARAATEPGFVGHPPDQAWFCGAHVDAARSLAGRTLADALRSLRADVAVQSQVEHIACAPTPHDALHALLVALAGDIAACFGCGRLPELVATSQRRWDEIDGCLAPECPFVDEQQLAGDDGRFRIRVTRTEAWWSPAELVNATVGIEVWDSATGRYLGGVDATGDRVTGTSCVFDHLFVAAPISGPTARAIEIVLAAIDAR
jgi:hypothetical protein